ncbi:L-asparaginase [Acidovorax sp. SRB_14]|uniref:asparaginase n=1 Tax=unclassified Acidovorax TaxID=2684926 RepID=UPI00145E92B4|nr:MULTISPECIES: asparaginase [unclassified Acidovorax]NMM76472.1 L-asparaginase [Acidovorax sp. SRB_24]NMM79557.1 L-asparaginase [Acidovorax sp. SRB_14]
MGTGGTIAGTAAEAGDNVGYTAAQVGVQALWQSVPGLSQACGDWVTEQVAQIDSKDMDCAVWGALAQRCQHHLDDPAVDAIVITHGTDTLEETAWFLHRVLRTDKPVVMTCAMRPATAVAPDGPQNLLDAVAVALAPDARGVLVACAGEVHGARGVQKVHPYRLNAFSSGEAGPLGWVEEGTVRLAQNWPQAQMGKAHAALEKIAQGAQWPRVEIAMSHAGASGATVDALVHSGVQGLVVAATGNGTVHAALQAALERAEGAGVAVRVASRCPLGQIVPGSPSTFIALPGLSPVKARVELMLELMEGAAPH